MLLLRLGTAVIARDVGNYQLLRRSHPQQLGVLDQVVRVLVVLVVADVIADVMQKRRVGEESSILGRAPETLANRVEQLERQALNVLRVRRLVVSPFCQLQDRTLASFAWIGGGRRDMGALQQNPLTYTVGGDYQLLGFDARGNLRRHGESADDDVTPRRVEPGNGLPLCE